MVPTGHRKTPPTDGRSNVSATNLAHASGHQLPIHATCIDSGYASDDIYDFVLRHQHRRLYATKGYAGRSGNPIVGKPSEKRYGRKPRPVRVYPINTDDAKADVMASVALTRPGPGYMHFPEHVDEEFFAQLCAEHRERNEALDCAVLCLAALRLLGNQNIRQMLEALEAEPPEGAGEARKPAAERERPSPRKHKIGRSSYLQSNR